MRVGILNYGLGNLGSVYSAFKMFIDTVYFVNSPNELEDIDLIVLSGVGNFNSAVNKLKELKFWDKLNEEVLNNKKPILGICLGMQLFSELSLENGANKGLGWIEGKIIKIKTKLKVPHIGWNKVNILDNTLSNNLKNNNFYFMHSYHFVPDEESVVKGTTPYGELNIVSIVKKDNILGVQFHPEKSQTDGLIFLFNSLKLLKG